MFFNQPNSFYVNYGIIADGAIIAAAGVSLTNADSGRIIGGVTFIAGGSTFTNYLGGIVSPTESESNPTAVIVTGSDGDDQVVNEGLIRGSISLGAGADIYVNREGQHYGSVTLGSDDDTYRLEGAQQAAPWADGGEGWDRFVMANTNYQVWGDYLYGFEELVLERGGNLENFSGYQSIVLAGFSPYEAYHFHNSHNPVVDIVLASQSIGLRNSSLRSITGGGTSDAVELGTGAAVGGSVELGGGDDWLLLSTLDSGAGYSVAGVIDGGPGRDTIEIHNGFGSSGTYDLGQMTGFDALWANSSYVQVFAMRVSNVRDVTDVRVGNGSHLILSASDLAGANVSGIFGGSVVLEADTTIGRFGAPLDGPWDQRIDLPQADDSNSARLVNHGSILGEVRFYTGDDLYDGRTGFVGGTVYGNGGNDTLLGGNGAERLEGGFGGDILSGGNGLDVLVGGAGGDTFQDTTAGLGGDVIADLEVGDRIVITDATFAGFSFNLTANTLTFTGGLITLTAPFGGTIVASAAAGGGVQLSLLPSVDVFHDFNGDGRSDILLRNDNGSTTEWLGQTNGGFFSNHAVAAYGLAISWHVDAVGDFNGDGRDDVLLRHDNGSVTNWLGQSNGSFFSNHLNASYVLPAGWHVEGAGDFNGDGSDDVLLRNDNGTITEWLGQPDGSFFSNHALVVYGLAMQWHVDAIGDFNGDGRDDLLLRHDNGLVTNWLGQADGSFFSNHANASYVLPAGWHVEGAGDFNGDGRDDLLLRNDNGSITEWLGQANGSLFSNHAVVAYSLATSWHVDAMGDFNGDGRDDVLLRHDNGSVTDWLGAPNGSFFSNHANASYVVPQGWHIQANDLWM